MLSLLISLKINLIVQVIISQNMIAMIVAQANNKLYHNGHPIDVFLPLAIKIFECLHQHAYN